MNGPAGQRAWERRILRVGALAGLVALLLAAACAEQGSKSRHDDDDDDNTGGAGGGGGNVVPGGPRVESLVASPSTLSDDYDSLASVTAMVTDPDGLADIVGGSLRSADGAVYYGPFMQIAAGTFSIVLTWDQIAKLQANEFETEQVLTLRAEFLDTTQKIGSADTSLTLSCGGQPACNGQCGDSDNECCATCGEFASGAASADELCEWSEVLSLRVGDCLCVDCGEYCSGVCDDGDTASQDCLDCFNSECSSELDDCYSDDGTP